MQAESVSAAPKRHGRRGDPVFNVAILAVLVVWIGQMVVRSLPAAYAFGDRWWIAAVALVSAGSLALLWNERRLFLAQPPVEPGVDEASWCAAEEDLAARDRLRDPRAVAIVALGVAVAPFAALLVALWWENPENAPLSPTNMIFLAAASLIVWLGAASLVASRRAEREGAVGFVEGSRPPAGWAALGAVAVGLPLAWLPLVLMAAAAARPKALLLLAVPALHAALWGWSSYAWRRPLRIDLRLREFPVDWKRRQRDARIARLPWLMFVWEYALVAIVGPSVLGEQIGSGWGFFLLPYWSAVMIGLVGTGWAFFTRPMRLGAAQGAEQVSPCAG